MTQLDYYTEDGPEWNWWSQPAITLPDDRRGGVEVRHGFTMGDLDRLARMAMRRSIGYTLLDHVGRYQAAWDGIVAHLFTADAPPDDYDLIRAGWSQLARDYAQARHGRGLTDDPELPHGPRFAAYWLGARNAGYADAVEERIAVYQVANCLTAQQRATLTAMAVHGSRGAAAAALGLTQDTFGIRLRVARRTALRVWFDHEPPPPLPRGRRVGSYAGLSDVCKRGHEWTPENTRWYRPRNGRPTRRFCRACERERKKRAA